MITQSLTITQVIFNNYQGIEKCYFTDVHVRKGTVGEYKIKLVNVIWRSHWG